jgi:hypothetical protein
MNKLDKQMKKSKNMNWNVATHDVEEKIHTKEEKEQFNLKNSSDRMKLHRMS